MKDYNILPSPEGIYRFLEKNPLFVSMPRESLKELVSKLELIYVKGGNIVIEEGEYDEDMYIVVHGRLRALKVSSVI